MNIKIKVRWEDGLFFSPQRTGEREVSRRNQLGNKRINDTNRSRFRYCRQYSDCGSIL